MDVCTDSLDPTPAYAAMAGLGIAPRFFAGCVERSDGRAGVPLPTGHCMTHAGTCRFVAPAARSARAGFSLVELLIVVGIIGLLIAITFAVGRGVVSSGKRQATADTIAILDVAMQTYVDEQGAPPRAWWVDPSFPGFYFVTIDGRATMSSGTPTNVNALGMFMAQASEVSSVKAVLDRLPSRFLRTIDQDGTANTTQPSLTTVVDAWGNPIRYVHPALDGRIVGQRGDVATAPFDQFRPTDQAVLGVPAALQPRFTEVRRNNEGTITPGDPSTTADSDGSRAQGQRAYFYSAGDDGLVGFNTTATGERLNNNDDNVYTVQPRMPRWTE